MKQCVYCGKEYPDEVVTCDLDGQPVQNTVLPPDGPLAAIPPRVVVSIVLFAILSAFSGVGVAWIAIAKIANHMNSKSAVPHNAIVGGPGDAFVVHSIPILIWGGVVGLVIGTVGKWISVKRKLRAEQDAARNSRRAG
jgi:hypothetical protein